MEQGLGEKGGLSSLKGVVRLIGEGILATTLFRFPLRRELSLDNVVDLIDLSSPKERFLSSAISAAAVGDVGAVMSNIALYRGMLKVGEIAKEQAINIIQLAAYKNGVEHYLRFAEDARDDGRLARAGEWLMNVKECIDKGGVKPSKAQQKRIDVLCRIVSKIM